MGGALWVALAGAILTALERSRLDDGRATGEAAADAFNLRHVLCCGSSAIAIAPAVIGTVLLYRAAGGQGAACTVPPASTRRCIRIRRHGLPPRDARGDGGERVSQTPEEYGYQRETWDRATAEAAASQAREVFGKVMFLVAVTAGFAAAGAYIGRDLSTGWAFACWGGALVLTIAMSFSKRREEVGALQLTMLFGLGLLLGLAIGPTIDAYSSLEDGGTVIAQAAGLTALFMAAMGTVGYVTKRGPTMARRSRSSPPCWRSSSSGSSRSSSTSRART